MDPVFLSGQLFTGLSVASLLLLTALGLALSFGLMRVINMAHGEFLMIGGYLTYLAAKMTGPGYLWIAFPLAFLGTALLGALLQTLKPTTRLAVCSGLTLPQQAVHSAAVADWKKSPHRLPLDLPTVFLIGR